MTRRRSAAAGARPRRGGQPITVTQRVRVDDLADLANDPPRAAIAFATASGPQCLPVAVRRVDGQICLGLDPSLLPASGPPDRGVLLVDDGRYWFELRAIIRRGALEPTPEPATGQLVSYSLDPHHEVAWDYASLREVPPDET